MSELNAALPGSLAGPQPNVCIREDSGTGYGCAYETSGRRSGRSVFNAARAAVLVRFGLARQNFNES